MEKGEERCAVTNNPAKKEHADPLHSLRQKKPPMGSKKNMALCQKTL